MMMNNFFSCCCTCYTNLTFVGSIYISRRFFGPFFGTCKFEFFLRSFISINRFRIIRFHTATSLLSALYVDGNHFGYELLVLLVVPLELSSVSPNKMYNIIANKIGIFQSCCRHQFLDCRFHKTNEWWERSGERLVSLDSEFRYGEIPDSEECPCPVIVPSTVCNQRAPW